jgi:UTP-glucose-1-phosphate uridylyltransferase
MSILVVMAAGMGSRYGGFKQVDPMGPSGETLVDFSVFDAIRAGFKKMVFVIKPEFEDVFRERISDRYRDAAEVVHVYQGLDVGLEGLALAEGRQKPWGTGHALLCAANAVTGAFAVINADDFYGHSSFRMIADYLSADSGPGPGEAALVGFALKNTLSGHGHVSRGVCTLGQHMHLQEVIERTRISRAGSGAVFVDENDKRHNLTGDEIVSMNLWGFHPSIFDHLQSAFHRFVRDWGSDPKAEFYIPSVVNRLTRTGALRTRVLPSEEVYVKAHAATLSFSSRMGPFK